MAGPGWAGHPQALAAHGPGAGRVPGAGVSVAGGERAWSGPRSVGRSRGRAGYSRCWMPGSVGRSPGRALGGPRATHGPGARAERPGAGMGRSRVRTEWAATRTARLWARTGLYALEPAFGGGWPVAGTRAARPRVRTGSPVSTAASACAERSRATACAPPCLGRSRVQALGDGRRLARFGGAQCMPASSHWLTGRCLCARKSESHAGNRCPCARAERRRVTVRAPPRCACLSRVQVLRQGRRLARFGHASCMPESPSWLVGSWAAGLRVRGARS